jgi:phage shock protein A
MLIISVTVFVFFLLGVAVVSPGSLPGRVLGTFLGVIGLKVRRFEQNNSLGRFDRSLAQENDRLLDGVKGLGGVQALVASLERELQVVQAKVDDAEARLDVLESQGVGDDDPRMIALATRLSKDQARLNYLNENLARNRTKLDELRGGLRDAHAQLRDAAGERDQYATDLETARAERTVNDALSGFRMPGASGLGDARRDLQAQVDRERGTNEAMQDVFGPSAADRDLDKAVAATNAKKLLEARRARRLSGPGGG